MSSEAKVKSVGWPVRSSSSRRWLQLAGGTLILFLLVLNFDARMSEFGSERIVKSTPDQMYTPSYPDEGGASFGVIMAANGPFVSRALESAFALFARSENGQGTAVNATIYSDLNGTFECNALKKFLINHQYKESNHHGIRCVQAPNEKSHSWGFRAVKLWAFTATPYDKTLYLDADAYPCASYDWLKNELSPALERYDIMAVHSSFRDGMPHALHWLNAGVIAFNNRSPDAAHVFARWLSIYQQRSSGTKTVLTDQRIFNEAVLASPVRVMALPPEFNCKSNYKSIRYTWAKTFSPAIYRHVRKNARCCSIASIGSCVIDHECFFPDATRFTALRTRIPSSGKVLLDDDDERHSRSSTAATASRKVSKNYPGRHSQW